jgi:hypothetical protein
MCSNCSSGEAPGTRLVVARAPALTIGFMVRSSLSSMPMTESKGNPVLLTPSLRRASAGPSVLQTRAKTKSLEMLWMVNSCSASPTMKSRPWTPATATPEGLGRGFGEGGDVVGHAPLVDVAKAVVAPRDDRPYVRVGRERPRRHPLGSGVVELVLLFVRHVAVVVVHDLLPPMSFQVQPAFASRSNR